MTRVTVGVIAVVVLCALVPISADGRARPTGQSLESRLLRLEAKLEAQAEARDRQANAFDAAASRIEVLVGALVAVIALAAIFGALLAIRWVRELAHRQVTPQIATAIEEENREVSEIDSWFG